jgi:hypothetical protein
MSKGGHTLLAAAIGGALVLAGRDLTLLGLVTVAAGRLPDAVEIVTGFGPNGERYSIIPHRTISHSPYIWLALFAVGLMITRVGSVPIGHTIAGVGLGAVVHLAIDLLSPSGVPLGNPFGRRTSFGPFRSGGEHPYLYRTSTPEEWPVLFPFAVMIVVEIVYAATIAHSMGFRPQVWLEQLLRG